MANQTIEIEVREITDGVVTETRTITQQDGDPIKRAFILAEGETQSALTMVNCDRVGACTMVRHNKLADQIAWVATLTDELFGHKYEEEKDNGELGETQNEEQKNL